MRCACGYDEAEHDRASLACPLCACGKLPGEHVLVAVPVPSPMLTWEGKVESRCPGKTNRLRRGHFREAPARGLVTWHAAGGFVPYTEPDPDEAAPAPEPRVRARPTEALDEIAPRAMTLGTLARARGWSVEPWYSVDPDGTEHSVIAMRREGLRAVASWKRAQGGRWGSEGGWGGLAGAAPVSLGIKELTVRIKGID